jgi:uncharacterized membrane protein (DUF485 family)
LESGRRLIETSGNCAGPRNTEINRGVLNMLSQADKEILKNADFHKLVSVRRWVSWSLLLVLLGLYLAFGLLSVHSPALLARPVFHDGVVPVGVAMGYLILALTFIFMLVYVWIANSFFEPLGKKIIAQLAR